MRNLRTAILFAAACLLIFSDSVRAEIDEVIVTATRRAENVQDVPVTMQVVTGDELQALGVDSAEDVLSLFSNLSFNGSNEVNKGFTIRGVGTNNFHGNVNRAVGVYQDEVSMSTPFSGVLGIYDVARIEVLRGPQNTLFGRNTTGGAIEIISNRPTVGGGLNGYAMATFAEDSQLDLEGALGLDLGERLAGRLSVQLLERDGLFTNMAPGREGEQLGKRDRQSARLQLLWEPSDSTSVLLNAHAGYNRGTNIGNKAIGLRDPNDPGLPCDINEIIAGSDYQTRNNCVAANGFNPSAENWATVYNASGAQADIDIEGGFVKLVHEFSSQLSLTSITATERTMVNQADDTGGFNEIRLTPIQDGDYEQFSQEVRLTCEANDSLRWLAGAYYFREDMLLGTHVVNGGANVIASNILDQEDTDFSVYGEIDYEVSDRLALGLGLRYIDNEKRAPSSIFRVIPRVPNGLTDPTLLITNDVVTSAAVVARTIPFSDLEADLNEVAGKLHARFQANEDVMVYLSYSEGFKSGGFDTRAIAALTPGADVGRQVGAERLIAWELGIKSLLVDDTLQINAAAFAYEWEDLQTFVVVGGIPGFANIPKSRLTGLEVDAMWAPGAGWQILGSVGFLDTEVTDASGFAGSIDEGHELPNSPEFSASLSVAKDFELNEGLLSLQLFAVYNDEQTDTFLFAADPYSTKDSTAFLNIRGSWSFGAQDQYELALWGANLTEEKTCYDIGLVDDPLVPMGQLSTTGACSPSDGVRRFGLVGKVSF